MSEKPIDIIRKNHEEILARRQSRSGVRQFLVNLSTTSGQSYEALKKAERRCRENPTGLHGNCLLTKIDEICLVALLREASLRGRPYDVPSLLTLVQEWQGLSPTWRGYHWFEGFHSRYSDFLKQATPKPITPARISPAILDATQRWTVQAEELFQSMALNPNLVFNCDETGIDPNFVGRDMQAIVSADLDQVYQVKYPSVDRISIVPIVSASGVLVLIALI